MDFQNLNIILYLYRLSCIIYEVCFACVWYVYCFMYYSVVYRYLHFSSLYPIQTSMSPPEFKLTSTYLLWSISFSSFLYYRTLTFWTCHNNMVLCAETCEKYDAAAQQLYVSTEYILWTLRPYGVQVFCTIVRSVLCNMHLYDEWQRKD